MKMKFQLCLLPALLSCAFLLFSSAGEISYYSNIEDGILVRMRTPGENKTHVVKIQVVSDNIIHVTASALDSFTTLPSLMTVTLEKPVKQLDRKRIRGICYTNYSFP